MHLQDDLQTYTIIIIAHLDGVDPLSGENILYTYI